MERILVLGGCGAGKSTFARRLHEKTGLELVHLDSCYFKSNWAEPDKAEWEKLANALPLKPTWIIEGNYDRTLAARLEHTDTIIYFDFPTWKCLFRVIKRQLKYYGRRRPDMAEGCYERFDFEFLHYVLRFNLTRRPRIFKQLEAVKGHVPIYIFRNDRDSEAFLANFQV